jgi:hypothetical protein
VIQDAALMGGTISNLFWQTDEHMERLKPFFPKSYRKRSAT